ncbi:MAG: hypothetical protein O2807_03620, partial [bacterium]|nr:hypothetical protein [bacterium]
KRDPVSDVRVVNDMFRNWGHRFIYNRSALQELLEAAGFAGCTVCAAGESGDPHLRGIDRHGRVMGDELNRFVTLVMEAAVPPAR